MKVYIIELNCFSSATNPDFNFFQGCHAEGAGGAVATESSSVKVLVNNVTFVSCYSSSVGGALSAQKSSAVTINATSFTNNAAYGAGGGSIYSNYASMKFISIETCT